MERENSELVKELADHPRSRYPVINSYFACVYRTRTHTHTPGWIQMSRSDCWCPHTHPHRHTHQRTPVNPPWGCARIAEVMSATRTALYESTACGVEHPAAWNISAAATPPRPRPGPRLDKSTQNTAVEAAKYYKNILLRKTFFYFTYPFISLLFSFLFLKSHN